MKPLLAAVLALALASPLLAGPPAPSPCCLENEFRQAALGCERVGPMRGIILYAEGHHPRLKAGVQGSVCKGKNFHGDGTFTNRWVGGVQALSECIRVEPSWLDGEPCYVMQYAPDAPIFPNVRDEVRQICP